MMTDAEKLLDEIQDEYFGLLLGFQKDGSPTEPKSDRHIYRWTRLKELQKEIYWRTNHIRIQGLEDAKRKLEEAFSPHMKELLSDEVLKKLDGRNEDS